MAETSRKDAYIQADLFDNTGGLNLTDSPFRMLDSQASGGTNYEYSMIGGFRKRNGHAKLNTSSDTELKSLGIDVHTSSSGTQTVIRAAGTKIQSYDLVDTYTNLSEDTSSAGTTFLNSSSTDPFVTKFFRTGQANVLWGCGAGTTSGEIFGVYSSTKVTQNGAEVPGGSIGVSTSASSGTLATGTYWYAVSLRKASTLVESNATLDQSVSVTLGDDVIVDLSSLSIDTTKYDKIFIYRSSAGGVTGFTAGALVATVDSTDTSYTDTGTSEISSTTVPRADSTVLDNSVLPSQSFKVLEVWKRRLVTAYGSTVLYSDTNKPESWPTANTITIPSAGDITGLAVISFTTPTSTDLDEFLVIFKQQELWVISSSFSPFDGTELFKLTFVDAVGSANQSSVVATNGYLAWIDYRGIYLWDGSGKPIYCSRPIESLFKKSGDLTKSLLPSAWGKFFRKNNQVVWCLSHSTFGTQKYFLKLDLKLTVPAIQSNLGGRVIDGVFIQDHIEFGSLYSGIAYLPTSDLDELFISGDGSGNVYSLFSAQADSGSSVPFSYETKFLDLGLKSTAKRFHKVIIWTTETTDADVTLDWWTTYRSNQDAKNTMSRPASTSVTEAVWDLGYWDVADWDDSSVALNPVVFNLQSIGAIEGDCIKFKISQTDANAPITIAGITVLFTTLGLRK